MISGLGSPLTSTFSCELQAIESLSWDDKWTWRPPDFYILLWVTSDWMAIAAAEQPNWQYRLDGVAARRGRAQDRFRRGWCAMTACHVMLLPLLLTLQIGTASASVASPAERDDLSSSRLWQQGIVGREWDERYIDPPPCIVVPTSLCFADRFIRPRSAQSLQWQSVLQSRLVSSLGVWVSGSGLFTFT